VLNRSVEGNFISVNTISQLAQRANPRSKGVMETSIESKLAAEATRMMSEMILLNFEAMRMEKDNLQPIKMIEVTPLHEGDSMLF
jgi:hypothetical protein